jgi:hypothetical protein
MPCSARKDRPRTVNVNVTDDCYRCLVACRDAIGHHAGLSVGPSLGSVVERAVAALASAPATAARFRPVLGGPRPAARSLSYYLSESCRADMRKIQSELLDVTGRIGGSGLGRGRIIEMAVNVLYQKLFGKRHSPKS